MSARSKGVLEVNFCGGHFVLLRVSVPICVGYLSRNVLNTNVSLGMRSESGGEKSSEMIFRNLRINTKKGKKRTNEPTTHTKTSIMEISLIRKYDNVGTHRR